MFARRDDAAERLRAEILDVDGCWLKHDSQHAQCYYRSKKRLYNPIQIPLFTYHFNPHLITLPLTLTSTLTH